MMPVDKLRAKELEIIKQEVMKEQKVNKNDIREQD